MANTKADTYSHERAAQIIRNQPSTIFTEEMLYSILYDAFTAGKNSIEFYESKEGRNGEKS